MASLDRSLGGNSADPHLPGAIGGGVHGGSSFFGSGDEGGNLGALGSHWISRLRPPPRPPSMFPPAAAAAAAVASAQGWGAFPIREPAVDLDGRAFLGERPPRHLAFSPLLLSRDAAAAAFSSGHSLQQQPRGAEAAQWTGGGELSQERSDMVAGFGPLQVRHSSAPLLLVEGLKHQQEHREWRLEGDEGGSSRRSCRPTPGVFPGIGRGNYGSFVDDGCFPFLRSVAGLGAVRGEAGEVARRDRGEKGLPADDDRWRVSTPPGTRQRDAVSSNGWRLHEASFFRQRGTLCMSPNTGVPSDVGSDGAAGSSQIVKKNQWLHHHRWGENPQLLDHHSASSGWTVGIASVTRPQVSVSCAGPRGLVGEASRPRPRDRHMMAFSQGAAYKETTNDRATTRTSYRIPDSNEVVQQQVVIKSSLWNIERIEIAHVVSSFCESLALDKRVGVKRTLHPDTFVPSKSQKPRTKD